MFQMRPRFMCFLIPSTGQPRIYGHSIRLATEYSAFSKYEARPQAG